MDNGLPKLLARFLVGVLIVIALPAIAIVFIAFLFPFSTEQGRNFAGFIIVPAVVVGSIMATGTLTLALTTPPKIKRIILLLVMVAFGGFGVWFIGGMLEFPFVYAFTQLHIRRAVAWNGSPITKILGSDIDDLYTDDYIGDLCPDYSTITIFRMLRQGGLAGYYFAYDTKSNVLVPLSEKAASDFPALMPPGDRLVNWWVLTGRGISGGFGDANLDMPSNWFHKLDLRENPHRSSPP